jgi:hypothetical protein
LTVNSLTIGKGVLSGSGTTGLDISGAGSKFTWTGGSISSLSLNLGDSNDPNSQTTSVINGNVTYQSVGLVNAGALTWKNGNITDSSPPSSNERAQFLNLATGVFTIDASAEATFGAPNNGFLWLKNRGTIIVPKNGGGTFPRVFLQNSGFIDLEGGSLVLQQPSGNFPGVTGVFEQDPTGAFGTLAVTMINSGATLTANGSFNLVSGYLTGNGTLSTPTLVNSGGIVLPSANQFIDSIDPENGEPGTLTLQGTYNQTERPGAIAVGQLIILQDAMGKTSQFKITARDIPNVVNTGGVANLKVGLITVYHNPAFTNTAIGLRIPFITTSSALFWECPVTIENNAWVNNANQNCEFVKDDLPKQFNLEVAAGLAQASIDGTLFADASPSGSSTYNPSTWTRYPGVTVDLWTADSSGHPIFAQASVQTDSNGDYSFTSNLTAPFYVVMVHAPSGTVFDPESQSSLGSNVNPQTGLSEPLSIITGQDHIFVVDAAIYKTAGVTGKVYNGTTGIGVPGTTVVVWTPSGTPVQTTTTNSSGAYSLNSLTPGTYTQTLTAPAGTLLDQSKSSTLTEPLTVTNNQKQTVNASATASATIKGQVTDKATKAGLPGVKIELTDANGDFVTRTDSNGDFEFTGVPAGPYTLKATAPGAYVFKNASGIIPANLNNGGTVPTLDTADPTISETVVLGAGATNTLDLSAFQLTDTVGGQLTDDGNVGGLAGAGVALFQNGVLLISTTTDDNGNWAIANVPSGALTVVFTGPGGYQFDSTSGSNTLSTSTTAGSSVNASAYVPGTVAGVVTDDGNSNAGVTDAAILLTDQFGNIVASATTGSDGSYSFAGLVPGNYLLSVTMPGAYLLDQSSAGSWYQPITIGDGDTPNFPLTGFQPTTISGNVANDAGGGLPGVLVTVLDQNGNQISSTATDANGNFTIGGLTAGSYSLQYAAPGAFLFDSSSSATLTTSPMSLGYGQTIPVSVNAAQPSNTIGGQISDDGTGGPLFGVNIAVVQNGTTVATTQTDSNGNFALTGIAAGAYSLVFTAPTSYVLDQSGGNTWSQALTVGSGPGNNVNASGYVPANLTGQVLDDGAVNQGLANVAVTLTDVNGNTVASTSTDVNGIYLLPNLAPGLYTLTFTASSTSVLDQSGSNSWSSPLWINDGDSDTIGASGYVPASVGGQITDDTTGLGVSNVLVELQDQNGNDIAWTMTDANGNYSIPGVPPGSGTLVFTATDAHVFDQSGTGVWSSPLTLGDNSNSSVNTTAYQPAVLSGQMTDDGTGLGLSGVLVTASQNGNLVTSTLTDVNGNYALVLPAGSFTLQFTAPGAYQFDGSGTNTSTEALSVNNGDTPTVSLSAAQPANTVGGQVDDDGTGFGLANVNVTLIQSNQAIASTTTDANGNFAFSDVSAGTYTLVFAKASYVFDGGSQSQTPTVGSGPGANVDASAYKPGSVQGQVLDDGTGQGLANVAVTLTDPFGDTIASAITGANGDYSFAALPLGTYAVNLLAPSGYVFDQSESGSLASDVLIGDGSAVPVDATAYEPATISGNVGNDQTPGSGLESVLVELLNQNGSATSPAAWTVTDVNGNYSFVGVVPGIYTVTFTAPGTTYLFDQSSSGTYATTPFTVNDGDDDSAVNASASLPASTTTLTASTSSSSAGDDVTFTVGVSSSVSNGATPTGTIMLVDQTNNNNVLASGLLVNGSVVLDTTALAAGSDTITAEYSGDNNFLSSSAATVQTVSAATLSATTAALTDTAVNPSNATQPVSLSVQVSCGSPTGLVEIEDVSNGDAVVASGTLTAGADGLITLSVPAETIFAGTHVLQAVYAGDSSFGGSTSNSVTQQVNLVITAVTVNGNPGNTTITSASEDANNLVTITTAAANGFSNDQAVKITVPGTTGFNGIYDITVVSPTTFTYTDNNASSLPSASAGTAVNALAGNQRSLVTSIVYKFSEPVNALAASDFSLGLQGGVSVNGGAGQTVGNTTGVNLSVSNPSGDGMTWVVTFSGTGIEGGSLTDGVYTLLANTASITSAANSSQTAQARASDVFAELFGSVAGEVTSADNSTTTVKAANANACQAEIGFVPGELGYQAYFDASGGGTHAIDASDLQKVEANVGETYTSFLATI